MTPAQVRQIAREEARAAAVERGGGSVPAVWTNEVQVYNACLAQQGVRTLRGLAEIVCSLQSGGSGGGTHVGPPCAAVRAFGFEAGRLTSIEHGTDLGGDAAVVVRRTTLSYGDDGRLASVLDTWTHEGTPYGRTVTLSYDESGQVARAVCSSAGPFLPPPGGTGM